MSESAVCISPIVDAVLLQADCRVDGRQERVQFDKITARVSRLCYGLDMDHVDPVAITQKVISGVYGGVTTVQLDDLVGWPPVPSLRFT